MKLINEIIAEAVDSEKPVTNLLRKCLILAFDLKNDKLKAWVENELNGYEDKTSVPDYRKAHLNSKGNFSGPFGGAMRNKPLPLGVLDQKYRDLLDLTYFSDAIASYETATKAKGGQLGIPWRPDLIALNQEKFYEGWALSSAWLEIPLGLFPSIVDTVKSRVLRFALEIREALGTVDDEPEKLPAAKIEAAVNTFIFGGNNVINSQVEQLSQQGNTIIAGDFSSLAKALKALGIADSDVVELKAATEQDAVGKQAGLGKKTKGWLTSLATKMGGAGWTIGTAAGVDIVKELVTKYLGG
jgi:AbiTii